MDRQAIALRPATPDLDEGRACARYLDEAAEGFIRFMLGKRAEDIVAEAFTRPNNEYSFQNATFSEIEGVICGMALGFTAEQHRGFSDEPLRQAVEFPRVRMAVISFVLAPLFRILKTVADGDFYLLCVAVDGDLRGRGVGKVLMDHVEDRARASGAVRLSLDVSAMNASAIGIYERRGMTVESQWPRRIPVPGLKLFRMTKTL